VNARKTSVRRLAIVSSALRNLLVPRLVFDCGMGSRFRTEFQGCAVASRENEHLAVNVQIGRWLRNLGRHTVEHTWHLANSRLLGSCRSTA
jgi:hypothetical protein